MSKQDKRDKLLQARREAQLGKQTDRCNACVWCELDDGQPICHKDQLDFMNFANEWGHIRGEKGNKSCPDYEPL